MPSKACPPPPEEQWIIPVVSARTGRLSQSNGTAEASRHSDALNLVAHAAGMPL
jgi:hypothetical protein